MAFSPRPRSSRFTGSRASKPRMNAEYTNYLNHFSVRNLREIKAEEHAILLILMLQRTGPTPLAFGKPQARDFGMACRGVGCCHSEKEFREREIILICWPRMDAKDANSGNIAFRVIYLPEFTQNKFHF